MSGTVGAPLEEFVAWVYSDPDGSAHHALNCSVADLDFEVRRRGHAPRQVRLNAAAVYELGSRKTDHGVPVQPFGDG